MQERQERRQIRTAVIGAGMIVPDFLEAAALIPEISLYAIFGRPSSLEKLQRMQKTYGFEKIYTDYEELLADGEVDCVYIALPNHLHYVYAKQALLARKDVILEKPFTTSAKETAELFRVAEAQDRMIFEAISNQYLPNFTKTAELLPKLGKIRLVQLNFSKRSSRYGAFQQGEIHPVFDPKMGGGAVMDLNLYNIHMILGLFGSPREIHYYANLARGVDTSGMLILSYPDFVCVSQAAKDSDAPFEITIQGEEGYLHADEPSNAYNSFRVVSGEGEAKEYALNTGKPRLYYELRTFADLLGGREEETVRARYQEISRHTQAVQEVLDEARRQAGILPERKDI